MTDVITNKVNVFTGLNTRVLDDDKDMNELLRQVFVITGYQTWSSILTASFLLIR